jgi:hypothetical protein
MYTLYFRLQIGPSKQFSARLRSDRDRGEREPNVAAEDTLACRGITYYWSLGQNEDSSTATV